MADVLNRSLAPISDAAWDEIDETAKMRLSSQLSARAVFDVIGPNGMDFAAVNTGRLVGGKKQKGLRWGLREVLPLLEVRVPFELKLDEVENLSRGAKDVDWEPLEDAARQIAGFEEDVVYNGVSGCDVKGVIAAAQPKPVSLPSSVETYPQTIGEALHALRLSGVQGPYDLVLGTKAYKVLNNTLQSGETYFTALEHLIGGSIHWSPALTGGLLVSTRGGDFELTIGQDLAIGYNATNGDSVEFFFIETFVFRVLEPRAAVALKPASSK